MPFSNLQPTQATTRVKIERRIAGPKSCLIAASPSQQNFYLYSPYVAANSYFVLLHAQVLAGTTVWLVPDGQPTLSAPPDPANGQILEREGVILRGQIIESMAIMIPCKQFVLVSCGGSGVVTLVYEWRQDLLALPSGIKMDERDWDHEQEQEHEGLQAGLHRGGHA